MRSPRRRLLDNPRGGGLADRFLLRITYGMGISRRHQAISHVASIGAGTANNCPLDPVADEDIHHPNAVRPKSRASRKQSR
jgi:hypothetical protein